mmetsp:Transcript_3906/g.6173  ORF Transcript_3906/g.6173 Transcript_3906/m.6173 type:complete len:190 (+) Transcript_3906:1974-2543(+)
MSCEMNNGVADNQLVSRSEIDCKGRNVETLFTEWQQTRCWEGAPTPVSRRLFCFELITGYMLCARWFVGSASRSESVKEVVEHFAEMIRENEKAGRESMWEGEEEEKTEPLNKSNCDDAVEGNSVLWPCESYCVLMRMPRWSTLILMPRTFWQQPPHNHHRAFSVVAEGGGGGAVQTLQRQTAEREKYS